MGLHFTSALDKTHRAELEELIFFHPQQGRFASSLISTIAEQGAPRIIEQAGKLRIEIPRIQDVQTLYAIIGDALQWELVGMVAYTRIHHDELTILHIAVKDEYTAQGPKGDQLVAHHLIEEICRIGHRIQGIKGVRLAYRRGKTLLTTLRSVMVAGPNPEKPAGRH